MTPAELELLAVRLRANVARVILSVGSLPADEGLHAILTAAASVARGSGLDGDAFELCARAAWAQWTHPVPGARS